MASYIVNQTWNETQTIGLTGGDPTFPTSNAVLVHIYFLWMAICTLGMLLSVWMVVARRAHGGLVKLVMHAINNQDAEYA